MKFCFEGSLIGGGAQLRGDDAVVILEVIGLTLIAISAFTAVSYSQLIISGILIDGMILLLGLPNLIPIIGFFIDALESFIAYFIVNTIIGGIPGLILGFLAAFIVIIPGPIPLVTITFLVIKILLGLIGG